MQHEQDELGPDNQDMEADIDEDEVERLQRREEEEMAARLIALEEKSMAAAKVKQNSEKVKVSSKKNVKESIRPTYASKVKTRMPGSFVTAQENTAVNHDTPQHEFASTTTSRDKKQGPIGHGDTHSEFKSTVPLRTRTPRRDSKQKSLAGVASSSSSSSFASSPALTESSFGSRIWGYAQSSPFLKNVDSISGGLFGTALATVAVLANTAEAATAFVKDNAPHKLTGKYELLLFFFRAMFQLILGDPTRDYLKFTFLIIPK